MRVVIALQFRSKLSKESKDAEILIKNPCFLSRLVSHWYAHCMCLMFLGGHNIRVIDLMTGPDSVAKDDIRI